MSPVVPQGFEERMQRLALGLEPIDALRDRRISTVQVVVDRPPGFPRQSLLRHQSALFTLLEHPAQRTPMVVRIFDEERRFVPRRLQIDLTLGTPVTLRPHFYPGSAYDASYRSSGMFGLVVRGPDQLPVRWARIEARMTAAVPRTGRIVGRSIADDRGEYLILLEPDASTIGPLTSPLSIEVTAFGPLPNPPVPATLELPGLDPYWDVPIEPIPAGAGPDDPVVMGSTLPATFGATATSTIVVSCPLGQLVRAPVITFQ